MKAPELEALNVNCICGAAYSFKPEYAGVLVLCPKCRKSFKVPDPGAADFSPFQRFALRRDGLAAEVVGDLEKQPWQKIFEIDQEIWSMIETYQIREEGKPILVADRPARFFNVGIYAVFAFFLFAAAFAARHWDDTALAGAVLTAGFLAAGMFALRYKFEKRHVTFWRDEKRKEAEFFVRDVNFIEFPTARFRVEDMQGKAVGELRKSWLGDLFRSPWTLHDAQGDHLLTAQEESLVLSLLRRLFITKLWWFRTNYILLDPKTEEVHGEYKRQWELHDHYIFDLSTNRIAVDVRLLLALAVLLDSAERR